MTVITTDTPLRFDRPVRPGGYAWWYLDAVSDDGAIGLTIIVFVGSVFSTRYARARRAGAGDPERHCAVNVAIYPRGGARRIWTMAEHGDFARDREHLRVGASAIRWRSPPDTPDPPRPSMRCSGGAPAEVAAAASSASLAPGAASAMFSAMLAAASQLVWPI